MKMRQHIHGIPRRSNSELDWHNFGTHGTSQEPVTVKSCETLDPPSICSYHSPANLLMSNEVFTSFGCLGGGQKVNSLKSYGLAMYPKGSIWTLKDQNSQCGQFAWAAAKTWLKYNTSYISISFISPVRLPLLVHSDVQLGITGKSHEIFDQEIS